MIGKYTKRPIEVEAIQWTGNNIEEILEFGKEYNERYFNERPWMKEDDGSILPENAALHQFPKHELDNGPNGVGNLAITLSGQQWFADVGDYVIKGIEGEIYFVKKEIFEQTYDKVVAKMAELMSDIASMFVGQEKEKN